MHIRHEMFCLLSMANIFKYSENVTPLSKNTHQNLDAAKPNISSISYTLVLSEKCSIEETCFK